MKTNCKAVQFIKTRTAESNSRKANCKAVQFIKGRTKWAVFVSSDEQPEAEAARFFRSAVAAQRFAQDLAAGYVADGATEDSEAGLWSLDLANGGWVLMFINEVDATYSGS